MFHCISYHALSVALFHIIIVTLCWLEHKHPLLLSTYILYEMHRIMHFCCIVSYYAPSVALFLSVALFHITLVALCWLIEQCTLCCSVHKYYIQYILLHFSNYIEFMYYIAAFHISIVTLCWLIEHKHPLLLSSNILYEMHFVAFSLTSIRIMHFLLHHFLFCTLLCIISLHIISCISCALYHIIIVTICWHIG